MRIEYDSPRATKAYERLHTLYDNTFGYINEEGKNDMEQNLNQIEMASPMSKEKLEEILALRDFKELHDFVGTAVTTDEAEPTDEERVLH